MLFPSEGSTTEVNVYVPRNAGPT